jgi:hypothetical protein
MKNNSIESGLVNKEKALLQIKELAKNVDKGDSMNDLYKLKNLMVEFEITEAEVNEMLGIQFLASDNSNVIDNGGKLKPRTNPYKKGTHFSMSHPG